MRTSKVSSRIESLESRIAPATITVSFVKGALVLTGDADAQSLSVVSLGENITVLTGGSMFRMDGMPDSASIELTTPLKSLSINLGDANDVVNLIGLKVSGDVKIVGGAGDNKIEIEALSTNGSFRYTGGTGPDSVKLLAGIVSVKKEFAVDMGNGDNVLATAASLQIGGKFSYLGGSGKETFTTSTGAVQIGGDFSFKPGTGMASLIPEAGTVMPAFTVGKNLLFDSSSSQPGDTILFKVDATAFQTKGNAQFLDGAGDLGVSSTVGFARIGGKFLVTGGVGTFSGGFTTGLSAKSISVDVSAGATSLFAINGIAQVPGGFTYKGGNGMDTISAFLTGGGSIGAMNIDLGGGTNAFGVLIGGGLLKAVKVVGGNGDDSVSLLATHGSIASMDIQMRGGSNVAQLALVGSTIGGKVSVTTGADAVTGAVTIDSVASVVGDLNISLPGGANSINFGSSPLPPGGGGGGGFGVGSIKGLTVKKALRVTTGDGTDTVSFLGAADLSAAGGISLLLGNGENTVGGSISNLSAKSLNVVGGAGGDSFALTGTGKLGAVSFALGAGVNSAVLTGGVSQWEFASLTFSSSEAAGNNDALALARVLVAGKFDAKFGAGGSILKIDDSDFAGAFTADTGAGNDTVSIDTTSSLYGPTVFTQSVKILLGADDDTLILGDNGSLLTKATFTADGGAGTNSLTNVPENTFAKTPIFTAF